MTDVAGALTTICITGGPASGKTTALIEHTAALLNEAANSEAVCARGNSDCGEAAWRRGCDGDETARWQACDSGEAVRRQTCNDEEAAWREADGDTTAVARPAALLLCATPQSITPVQALLDERGLSDIEVTTPYDYALRVLSDPRAVTLTGRKPHILSEADEAVFFEDMKTSGIKKGRLRKILAFLARGLADLRDDDPTWIQTTEEEAIIELAQEALAFTGGMLRHEVVNLAVRALQRSDELRESYGAPLVLVDDYHLVSRASQTLAALVAKKALVATADDAAADASADSAAVLPAFEPYPNPIGLAELRETHPDTTCIALDACYRPAAVTHALRCVRKKGELRKTDEAGSTTASSNDGARALDWRCAPSLVDELALVADIVAGAIAQGTRPDQIGIAGVNGAWRANLIRALRSCGIPAQQETRATPRPLGASAPRVDERAQQAVLNQLIAHPDDSLAWRRWCGFGDHLARSAAMAELRAHAAPLGLSLTEALAALKQDSLAGFPASSPFATNLLAAYDRATTLIESAKSCNGHPSPTDATDEDRSSDAVPATAAAVRIGHPEDFFGRTFELVVFGGFVNGFIPSRDYCDQGVLVGGARKRARQADLGAIERVASCATGQLIFTGFESCSLEAAEQLKLHIARIRLKDGVRTCTIEPSDYLKQLKTS